MALPSRRAAEPVPPLCPACRLNNGVPVLVKVEGGKTTIVYKCPKCANRWSVTRADDLNR
jgi:hypothetical protein